METQLDKAHMKERLEARLKEVSESLASLEAEMEEKPDYGMGKGDPQVYEWEMNLARIEQLRSQVEAYETALERLEAGGYGICQNCGNPINPERLEAIPLATLCIQCASKKS